MIELPLWSPILLALSEASICSALLKCLGLCVWIGFINTSQRINFDSSQQTVGRAWISEDKQNQDTTNCWQGDGNSILECKTRYCGLFISTKSTKNRVYYAKLLNQRRIANREKRGGEVSYTGATFFGKGHQWTSFRSDEKKVLRAVEN